jgi:uncharacterized repeat protein (TIGR01451 family)
VLKRLLSLLIFSVLLFPSVAPYSVAQEVPATNPRSFRSSPVMFIENVGQFAEGARFQVRGSNGTMWLAEDAVWLTVIEPSFADGARSNVDPRKRFNPERANAGNDTVQRKAANIKLSFSGANAHPRIEPFDRLDTVVSYFIGNDPDQWRPDVPVWGGVRYVDLYPGVDLEITSEGGQMVQRLAARPDADLSAVLLRVEGADAVTANGDALRLSTAVGEFSLPLLRADGLQVAGLKVRSRGTQAFDVAAPFAPAIANPASLDASSRQSQVANPQSPADNPADLLYGTFLGGSGSDDGNAIVVDRAGSAYVTGSTYSGDFPTTPGAFDTSFSGYCDAFVVKLNPAGSGLAYATFLGGSSDADWGFGIAVDEAGSAYVTGSTVSSDFPTTPDAFDMSLDGGSDVFVVKLNPAGSGLAYATFLGGSSRSAEWGYGIVVDGAGSAYVTGYTFSSDFPTTPGAFDASFNGYCDAFVVKLNGAGSGLAYATFLGGSGSDDGNAIVVDRAGSAYVTGSTYSGDFPTTPGAFDTSFNGGAYDTFVAKLNPAGSGLAYATFLGGSSSGYGSDIAVDWAGNAYVTGLTTSTDFPTTLGAFDTSFNGRVDAFVVKLNGTGSGLAYATFLGGSHDDEGYGIAVDGTGSAYVTGATTSTDFPTTLGAFDTSFDGRVDAFVVKLNGAGSALAYATFLGGSGGSVYELGAGIVVDGAGSAYVMGQTDSSDFPTTASAFGPNYNGGSNDAFVVKLAMGSGAVYTVSGRVTEANSNGVSGVTLSEGAGGSAITDGNGAYTISGLAAGTYTLTPSKSGYAFAPTSRTVLLPRDSLLPQDFYAQATAGVVDPQQSAVSVNPSSVAADGQAASTVTVLLRNAAGAPVAGEAVRLVVEAGQAVIEQPPISDSAGQTVGRVRSFAPGAVTVSAWVRGSRLPAAVNITFVAGASLPDPLRASARMLANSGAQTFDEMWRDIQGVVSEAYYFQNAQLVFKVKIAADIVSGVVDAFEVEKGWRESDTAARLAFPGWGVLADSPAFANETACKISNSFITDLAGAGDAGAARKVAGLVFRGGLLYLTAQHNNQCVKDVVLDVALNGNSLLTLLGAHFGQPTDSWPIKKQIDTVRQVQQAELNALEQTRIPPLSAAQVQAYSADLSSRAQMLPVFQDRLHDALLTLQNVHAANESTGWGGELLQTILRQTATLAAKGWFDGAGRVLVAGYLTAFDTYMDSHALSESIQMSTLAYGTMSYTAPQAVLSAGNTVIAGLDQINRGLPPHTPKGAITKVQHTNIAAGWGPWHTPLWASTDLSLSNTGTEGADFYVVARYLAQTTRLTVPWAQLWLESDSLPVHLAPGEKAVVRVNYLGSGLGYPPRETTFIQFTLVGADDAATGLFHAAYYATPWPAAQSQSGALADPMGTDGASALSPVIDYPLVSLAVSNPAQGFNGYLWVNNPYTVSVPVTVTQPIAANMTLDDAGLGISASQQITWTAFVAPLASQMFTYTFRLSDAPGVTLTLPAAVLSLASPDAGVLTATATTRPVPIPWPVTLNRRVPTFTAPGIAPSVTVTATNHLSTTVTASVAISVTTAAGLPIWSSSQPLTLTGQISQTTIFTLPADLPAGDYDAIGFLETQGGRGRVFDDLFTIGARPPDLAVIAAPVAADGTIMAGATITYTIRVVNTAAVPLTNLVISTTLPPDLSPAPGSISDGGATTPGGVTWHVNTLAAGATRTLSYRVAIPLTYVPPGAGRYIQTTPTLTAHECPQEITGISATVLVLESKRVFLPMISRSQ